MGLNIPNDWWYKFSSLQKKVLKAKIRIKKMVKRAGWAGEISLLSRAEKLERNILSTEAII